MALLTESSVKLLQTRIDDAETTLRAQESAYGKANDEYNTAKSEVKDKELEFEAILTKFKDDGKTQISLFEAYVRDYNQAAKNAGTTALQAEFSTEEYKEAWGYEYVFESTPPLDLDEEGAKKRLEDYNNSDLASKHTTLRAERDALLKGETTEANTKKAAKQTKVEDVITEEKSKAEKAVDTAKNALTLAKSELEKAEEEGADEATLTTLRANLTTAETDYQNANTASDNIKEITDFLTDHMTEFNTANDGFAKAANEAVLARDVYNYTLKPISEYVEEAKSSDLLKRFEEEVKTRKEHVKETTKNKERIKVLLEDKNDTVGDKLNEMKSDSSIFIKDIKAELEFTPAAESKLERIQSALDGSDFLFTASQAFDLASESIYSTKAIVEKIKKACYAGETSIDLLESEVSGTQILMLDKVGYKITHASISNPGRKLDDLVITIDWGFATES